MKILSVLPFLLVLGMLSVAADAAPVGKKPFEKVIYLNAAIGATQSALNSGGDYTSAKGFVDGDLMAIPAGVIIEQAYFVVDTAVSGATALNLGDDDDADGFIADASTPLNATGLHYYGVTDKGVYLAASGEIAAKLYSAAGKEVKLDVTGTITAGKARLILRGFAL